MDLPEGRSEATGGSLWEGAVTDEPNLVRPYILTAGRTEPRVVLPLEAPIESVDAGEPPRWLRSDVRGQILAMCLDHPSVAEIAARLSLPLGVARVLIGDLVTQGFLAVRTTLSDSATIDERRELIGRTLRGLKAL